MNNFPAPSNSFGQEQNKVALPSAKAPRIPHETVRGSSSVKSIGYDAESRTLEIGYHNSGAIHAYHDVPYETHLRLMGAKSKGQFVEHMIKKNYRSRPVSLG